MRRAGTTRGACSAYTTIYETGKTSMSNDTTNIEETPEVIEDDPIKVRYNKRQAIIDAGELPYAHRWDYDCHLVEINEKYADLADGEETEDTYSIAGRIMAIRNQGKICFVVVKDATDEIQLFCRLNLMGEEAYARLTDLDVGDWI
ncbi:MAG: OB-fold nucleic acid binding domain-containing protein, partial [Coriobacteriales bacterium]